MKEEVIGILDADSIAYRCAAANEVRTIKTTHIEKGVVEDWKTRTEFRKYLAGTDHTEDMYTIVDVQTPKDQSYGRNLIRDGVENAKTKMRATKIEIYISGDGNFREAIPFPMRFQQNNKTQSWIGGQYKENREGSLRPVQLSALRDYMVRELGAIPVHGMEVDDMSSIRAYDGVRDGIKIIQYTADKDAGQCVGWLQNPDKDETPRYIQGFGELHQDAKGKVRGTGRMFLYWQVLAGDKVDNYRPVDILDITTQKAGGKKVEYGDVTAYKALKNCKNDKEAWRVIYDVYSAWYPEPTTYEAHDGSTQTKDAVEIMQMYVDAAHMKRWADDRIDVPTVLTKMGVL